MYDDFTSYYGTFYRIYSDITIIYIVRGPWARAPHAHRANDGTVTIRRTLLQKKKLKVRHRFQVTKLFGHVRMIPSYSEAMLMDPAPPAYIIDCPSPFDLYETSQTMTIFRTCSPNYVPANLVRYVESGPYAHAYPPTYEEALRYPLFELSVDDRGNSNVRSSTRTSTAITFETSL